MDMVTAGDGGVRRVVRVDHASCLVTDPAGPVRARAPMPVAVGDWVELSGGPDPTVAAVLARRTAVTRRDPTGQTQVLAANVDLVLVTAPADRLSLARVEREVTIGWDSGAEPVVLLTKSDLDDGSLAAALAERVMGVDILRVSSVLGQGLDDLRKRLAPDRTAVLLGPSGAGKSTLVNGLLGQDVTPTGAVRESDHRGRHVTTARHLHAVPGGGSLIDTPGLRSLSLAVDAGALGAAFPDILELAASCRFRDCGHDREPGCAVLAADGSGGLPPGRLASYRTLVRELEHEARRNDPRAAREAEAVWRQRRLDGRRLFKERGYR